MCGWFLSCFSDGESLLRYFYVVFFSLICGFVNVYPFVFPVNGHVYLV